MREPRLQAGATPSLEELGPPGREEARETQRPALSSCRLPPAAAQLGQTQLAGGRHDVLLASCPYGQSSREEAGAWTGRALTFSWELLWGTQPRMRLFSPSPGSTFALEEL